MPLSQRYPTYVFVAVCGFFLLLLSRSEAQLTARERTQQTSPSKTSDCSNVPWQRAGLKLSSLGGCNESTWPSADRGSRSETVVRVRATTGVIEFEGPTGVVLSGAIPAAVADDKGIVKPTLEIIGTEITDTQHPETNTFIVDPGDLRVRVKTAFTATKQFGGVLSFPKGTTFRVANTSALSLPYVLHNIESGDISLDSGQPARFSGMSARIQDCKDTAPIDLGSDGGQPTILSLSLVTGESKLIGGSFAPVGLPFATPPYSVHCNVIASSFNKIEARVRISFTAEGASVQLNNFRATGEILGLLVNATIPTLAQGNFYRCHAKHQFAALNLAG